MANYVIICGEKIVKIYCILFDACRQNEKLEETFNLPSISEINQNDIKDIQNNNFADAQKDMEMAVGYS